MNPDRTTPALPDTFALHEGELIALQVHTAHALGLPDIHFRDNLPERPLPGRPQVVVTKGGSWFDGPEDCRAAAGWRTNWISIQIIH